MSIKNKILHNDRKEILISKFDNDVKTQSYSIRLVTALDQFFNVLFFNGSQDETISSNIGRKIQEGKANWFERFICKALRAIQSRHCIINIGE